MGSWKDGSFIAAPSPSMYKLGLINGECQFESILPAVVWFKIVSWKLWEPESMNYPFTMFLSTNYPISILNKSTCTLLLLL